MKLWILFPIDGHWRPWYDTCASLVVRASTEDEARQIATNESGDEGEDVWLDNTKTTCEPLTEIGEAGVVLRDYRAG